MKDNNLNKSLLKAMAVLKCFTLDDLELGPSEIAHKVEIPLTTAHRILATLTKGGLLEQDAKSGKYRIGPTLYALGSLYLSTTDIFQAAEPVIKALNDLTGEAVCTAILYQGKVVMTMKEESRYAFRIANHVGSILVAYASAMGKALLSELSEEELDRILPEEKLPPRTKNTVPTKTELKRELEEIRKTGVSYDLEGNYEGVVGIASVIRDASGKAVAAVTIGLPAFRADEATRERIATLVKMGASLISYRLGYQDTVNPVRDIEEIRSWWEQNQVALGH
ncbi:MAG TPA: IclR family transcriptional regulator [Dehalococcoidia bacterium]|nr:IclR family transcriptional regulator [Dehalococcoidia bacterium]